MASRRNRINSRKETTINFQSIKDENESGDDILATVDQFIESVYRDLSIPRRSSIGNNTFYIPAEEESSSSLSATPPTATPSAAITPAATSLPTTSTFQCSVPRRNMDAEIEKINRICNNVDENLRSIGVFMNNNPTNSNSEVTSDTHLTSSPDNSTSRIIPNNEHPPLSNRLRRYHSRQNTERSRSPSITPPAEEVIDLSNSQTDILEIHRQPFNIQFDDDDVILVSENIPNVVDLCSPNIYQNIPRSRYIANTDLLNRRRFQNYDDTNDEDTCSMRPPSMRRPRMELSSSRIENEKTSEVNEATRTPFICPVCMESCLQRQPTSTICGHVYCKSCIEQSISYNNKCPLCKKKISKKQLFRIYL